jgi:hypothetical protein
MKRSFGAFLLSIGVFATAPKASAAIDNFNLLGPAFAEGSSETLFVRKSDGSIWHCGVPNVTGWLPDGKPSTGATSGPQVVRIQNGGIHQLILVEVGDIIFANDGGVWSSFLPSPPGGFAAGLSTSYDFPNRSFHITTLGFDQNTGAKVPFVISVSAPPPPGGGWIVGPWTQIGTFAVDGSPGIGELNNRIDMLALNASLSDTLQIDSCQFPPCLPGYMTVPGPIQGFASPTAIYYDTQGANGGPFMAIAVRGQRGAVVDVYTQPTNSFAGAVSRGGDTINGPVAVTIISPQNPLVPRLAAHFTDGNYRYNPQGTGWISLSHP